MRKLTTIEKELKESKLLATAQGIAEDEKAFILDEIKDLEKELEDAKKHWSKKADKKPAAKKTTAAKKTPAPKKATPTPAKPKERKFIVFHGKKIYDDDPKYCDKMVQAWEERQAQMKKAAGKRKTRPVMQQVAKSVASSVKKGIKEISKNDLDKDPKKAIKKMERLEKAGKEYLEAYKDVLGEKLTKKEIQEEFGGLDATIENIKKKYINK